jgi:hypothetical protein
MTLCTGLLHATPDQHALLLGGYDRLHMPALQVSQPGSLQASPRTASQQASPRSPRLAHHASYIKRGASSSRLSHKSDLNLSGMLDPLADDDTMRDLNSANPLCSLSSTEVPGSPAKARLLGIRFVTPINSPHGSCRSPRISTGGEPAAISVLNSPRGSSRPCSPLASMTFAGPSPYGRLLSSHSSLRPPAPWADSPIDSPTGESSSQHQAHQHFQLHNQHHVQQHTRGSDEHSSMQRPASDPSIKADDDGHGHCMPFPDSGSPTYGRRVSASRLAAGSSRLSQSSVGRCSSSTIGTPQRVSRSSGGGGFEVPDHSHVQVGGHGSEQYAAPCAAASFKQAAAALGLPPPRHGLPAAPSSRTSLSQSEDADAEQQAAHMVEPSAGRGSRGRQLSSPDPALVSRAAALTQAGVGGQVMSRWRQQGGDVLQQQAQQQDLLYQRLQEEEAGEYPDIPEVTFIDMLGRGSYGNVYKGEWGSRAIMLRLVELTPIIRRGMCFSIMRRSQLCLCRQAVTCPGMALPAHLCLCLQVPPMPTRPPPGTCRHLARPHRSHQGGEQPACSARLARGGRPKVLPPAGAQRVRELAQLAAAPPPRGAAVHGLLRAAAADRPARPGACRGGVAHAPHHGVLRPGHAARRVPQGHLQGRRRQAGLVGGAGHRQGHHLSHQVSGGALASDSGLCCCSRHLCIWSIHSC